MRDRVPRVLHAAAEGLPFSKTGGLADVLGALPRALTARGLAVGVVLPAHPLLPDAPTPRRTGRHVTVELAPFGARERIDFEVLEARIGSVTVWLLANARLFEREGLYVDGEGRDYPDNWLRYAAFARAAGELAAEEGFELVQCHDWHTALLPVYEAAGGGAGGGGRFRTLLTIHNVPYQGMFPAAIAPALRLPEAWLGPGGLEFYGRVNFLKGGILAADALSTVSPTYAREILTPELGAGLEGVLRERRDRLTGILNGVDYAEWDPARDPYIAAPYEAEDLAGKAACKAALQRELGLIPDPAAPLAGVVSRLTGQKGWDLLLAVLPPFLAEGLQLAALGSGEPDYETGLEALAHAHPERAGVRIGFDVGLAHRIEAGADFFLMPSRYEPCGLNQLYSLRYGTPPVVRATGGLADTVVDAAEAGRGTGYVFEPYTVEALAAAMGRAVRGFRDGSARELQRRGMRQDFSWSVSAAAYARLYSELAETIGGARNGPAGGRPRRAGTRRPAAGGRVTKGGNR